MKSKIALAATLLIVGCKPNIPIFSPNYMYECSSLNFITFISDNKKWAMVVVISGDKIIDAINSSYNNDTKIDLDLKINEGFNVGIFGTNDGFYHCERGYIGDVEDDSWIDYYYKMNKGFMSINLNSNMEFNMDSCGVFATMDFHFSDYHFIDDSNQDQTDLFLGKIMTQYSNVPFQQECD